MALADLWLPVSQVFEITSYDLNRRGRTRRELDFDKDSAALALASLSWRYSTLREMQEPGTFTAHQLERRGRRRLTLTFHVGNGWMDEYLAPETAIQLYPAALFRYLEQNPELRAFMPQ